MSTKESRKLVVEDPNYSSRYFKALAEFREARRFTDITLQVGDTEFVAHRAVLSAASPFFNAMFDDAFAESQKEKVNLLHETNVAVMSAVLDYMYSGKLTIAIKEAALLLRNFDYFQMDGVKEECEKALLKTVNAENCLELLLMAGGAQWLLESFFNLKHSNLYIFSTKTECPVYSFNPKAASLHQIAKQPLLDNFSAVKYKDSIYVVAGQANDEFTDDGTRYDIKKKVWTNINCPIRKNQCGLCVADDKMYIVGGWIDQISYNTVSSFDFERNEILTLPNIEFERYSPGVTYYNEISLPGLHETAADFVLRNFKEFCNSDEINHLTIRQLETILNIGNVRHPDTTYKIIISWIRFDETNRNSYIHNLLSKYVKATNLSEDLIVQKVPKYIINDDFIANHEGGAQWLLESFFNLKHSNLYIFSTKTECPVYSFNPKAASLHQIAKQPLLDNFSAVKYKDSIYVVGGQANDEFTDDGTRYDIKKKLWTNINCPIRKNQCGLCVADDKMYIVGGWIDQISYNTVSSFDFERNEILTLPNIEFERYSPGVTYYNSSIYVFGGHSVLTDDVCMSFVERYDPREGKWAHAGTIDNFDIGCTCALVSNSIYWKDWNASLQYFDPRCQLSELVQEFTGFGTITSFEDSLYLANEEGISQLNSDDEQCTVLFMTSFKSPFIIA